MKSYLSFGALALLLFTSCGNENLTYSSFSDIPQETWNWDNSCVFEFEINDESSTYNQFIDLRLTENYPKSNIYIKSETVTPAGDTINKLHNLLLFSKHGVSLGTKSGKLLNYANSVKKNQVLKKGKYRIKLTQHTRIFELEGVNAVGFTLEKGEPVF